MDLEDKWVLSRLNKLIRDVTANLDSYEVGRGISQCVRFYLGYLLRLVHRTDQDSSDRRRCPEQRECQRVLCYVWEQVLAMLHPFMPFITEEIWQALPHSGDFLMTSPGLRQRRNLIFLPRRRPWRR